MADNDQIKTEQRPIKKGIYNRLIELYVWMFLAFLVVFPALYYSLRHRIYEDFLLEFYNQFLLGVLLILTPVLFKLIFGKLPLEYLRSKREGTQEIKI